MPLSGIQFVRQRAPQGVCPTLRGAQSMRARRGQAADRLQHCGGGKRREVHALLSAAHGDICPACPGVPHGEHFAACRRADLGAGTPRTPDLSHRPGGEHGPGAAHRSWRRPAVRAGQRRVVVDDGREPGSGRNKPDEQ